MNSSRSRRLALALALLSACLPALARADSWAPTGAMSGDRAQFTATLLPNGQVLAAGGVSGALYVFPIATSERWDPSAGRWLPSPALPTPVASQGASALADGRVLLAGGHTYGFMDPGSVFSSAYTFDPATNVWGIAVAMPHAHVFPLQVTLADGRVLVIGGYNTPDDLNQDRAYDQIELYDPAGGTWSTGAAMPDFMARGTATLLADGSVLVAGGSSSNTMRNVALRYFPATNRWRDAGSFTDARRQQVAARLGNGKVLIAGGAGGGRVLKSAALYDPATNGWTDVAPMAAARQDATATLLPTGKVLVAGGYDGARYVGSAELFDPATNTWSPAASMRTVRAAHQATLLSDGRVLVSGGENDNAGGVFQTESSAEIYTPDGWPFGGGGSDGSGGGSGGSGGGSGASGIPAVSHVKLSATRFRAAASGPIVTTARRRPPVGTTISWTDSKAAVTTFAVQRPSAGRSVGGHCVRPTRANRRHRRCTRWTTLGSFTHADVAGPNLLRFSGRLGRHKLAIGSYRFSLAARLGRGRASAARTIGFGIVG